MLNRKVEIKSQPWAYNKGTIIAIAKEGQRKEYIIQFTCPNRWAYFQKKEFTLLK